jgi:hypothetical protein
MNTCFICGEDIQWEYACEDVDENGSKDCWNDYGIYKLEDYDIKIIVAKLREMPKDQMLLVLAIGDLTKLVTSYDTGG